MEGFGGSGFDSVGNAVRKKRSSTYRRPRSDSQTFPDSHNVNNASCHENNGCDTGSWKRELNLNQCALGFSSVDRTEGETSHDKTWKDDGDSTKFGRFYGSGDSKGSTEKGRSESDFKRCSEGVLAPANWKSTSVVKESELQLRKRDSHVGSEGNGENRSSQHSGVIPNSLGTENKLRKVKLKVGGVTRTIHAKSTLDGVSGGGCASIKSTHSSDASRPCPKLIHKGTSDDALSPLDKVSDFQGVRLKDFSRGGFGLQKEGSLRAITSEDGFLGKQTDKSEPVRKSKRVPKRRVLDGAFDDGDDNEEIRYLERFKPSEVTADYTRECEDNGEEGSKKQRRISRVLKSRAVDSDYDVYVEYASSQLHKDNKNSKPGRLSKDIDYVEEEEPASDGDPEVNENNQKKEFVDSLMGGKKELSLTKRQQSLQSGKDISAGSGLCLIEFPNGLPPAPPRKQKEKLSEVEQQLKKAEVAQRRRMQMEKAARESEAEAIRKILGQDSTRKKREDKMKKRRDELTQERAANALKPPSNTVRWVIGPTGTVVIFPHDIGLPNIFDPRPCSYPPPREKCAGPLCTNTYKYRDSKSKLPLCSLQCYRAIHEQMQLVSTC